MGGWSFFAAKAISQCLFFSCIVCLRGIQKLIWGINQTEKIKPPNLQFLEYPLHNPEPQSADYAMGLRFWCSARLCPAAVSERRRGGRLVDLCRVRTLDVALPFVSACVCLPPASLAASSQPAVSASDSQQHPLLTLHNLASVCVTTGLPRDYCLALSLCVFAAAAAWFSSVSLFSFWSLLSCNWRAPPCLHTSASFSSCCPSNVCFVVVVVVVVVMCLLCLCSRSHLIFSEPSIC